MRTYDDGMLVPTLLGALRVRVRGRGPAMVCWPSLLMTGAMWRAQAAAFEATHTVLCIDPPGHGDSALLTGTFTLEACALALRQILDVFRFADCVLVGNSWGGMMGGVFAALYPERTRAAVLMNCTASAAGLPQRAEYAFLTTLLKAMPEILTRDGLPKPLLARAVEAFVGPTTERRKPDVVSFVTSTVGAANVKSVAWAIESVVPRRRDHHGMMAAIEKPVLVMTGEEDRTFPVAETKRMADAVPGALFVVLPKVGHLAALEAPDLVNTAIAAFLESLPA